MRVDGVLHEEKHVTSDQPEFTAAEGSRINLRFLGWLVGLGTLLIIFLIWATLALDDAEPDVPASAQGQVLDLMTIIDSGGIVIQAHGDGTATVLATTTIDVVCAVAYGPTENLGSISTDDDMAGGAHSDHHPLMVGLEENTDYFYQLNGIGPGGELYTTDLRSFTNGANVATAPGPNIAASGTVAEVSSEFSAAFAGPMAIDGDPSTEWSSAGDGDDAYIVVDLGAEMAIGGVGFRTREMSDGTSITTSFTVTIDGGDILGPFPAGVGLAVAEFDAVGRSVRVDVVMSTGGNTGAVEIEIYGAAASGTT